MAFISFSRAIDGLLAVLRKFPIECLIAVAGTTVMISLIEIDSRDHHALQRILIALLLALPSFLAIHLRTRFRKLSKVRSLLEHLVVLGIIIGFYFTIDNKLSERDMLHFMTLNVVAHLMVAVAGFIGRGSTHAFWQFNRILFIRLLTAGIFTAVLFAGLAGALASLDALFLFKIESERYAQLGVLLFGIFQTFFFLAGVPDNAEELERINEYPRVLKVFVQYVLLPLVSIYLCILLAYEIKIIITQKIPSGWVTNLIIGYGIAGILSILLLYPLRHEDSNQWIQIFSKWFYRLLLPLVALMWVAIGMRVAQYGFTIERVMVCALAIWLTAMALLYLFKPQSDIRIIPLSLAITGMLVSIVGWKIAKQSQLLELKTLLSQNNKAQSQPAKQTASTINNNDKQRISSIVEYLIAYHSWESVAPIFNVAQLSSEEKKMTDRELAHHMIKQHWHFDPELHAQTNSVNRWFNFYCQEAIPVEQADVIIPYSSNNHNRNENGLYAQMKEFKMGLYRDGQLISVEWHPKDLLHELSHTYSTYTQLTSAQLSQQVQDDKGTYRIYYTSLGGYRNADSTYDDINCEAIILVDWKVID